MREGGTFLSGSVWFSIGSVYGHPVYGNYEASKQARNKCARVSVPSEYYPSRITPISGVQVLYIVSIVKLKNHFF